MKPILFVIISLIIAFNISYAKKPNVVVLLVDDLGSIDLNCYGAKDLQTPAIDALAKNGLRFTDFNVAAPLCSASRAGFMSGKAPYRAGVPMNVDLNKKGMYPQIKTLAEIFKENGYVTGHFGKWHLGDKTGETPNEQGFDYSIGHHGGCIDNYSHFFYWAGPNKHDLYENGKEIFRNGKYFPDLIADKAVKFIEENKDNPFFMYFAVNLPHYPYQGYQKWLDYYNEKNVKYPRNLYAAFVSTLDEVCFKVIDKIRSLNLQDDTIIIFFSDNGHSTEMRAHFGGGESGGRRGAKMSVLQGGINMPMIISYPKKLGANRVRTQFVTSCDFYPTLVDLCNLKGMPSDLDGISIKSVLENEKALSPHKSFCFECGKQFCVRMGDYTLVKDAIDTTSKYDSERFPKVEDKGVRLYNIKEDKSQTKDLSKLEPELIEKMLKVHSVWKNR